MTQQINLLRGFKPPPKPLLPAQLIVKIVIALVVILAGLQIQIVMQHRKLTEQYQTLVSVQELRGSELARLSEQLPDSARNDVIRREVETLTEDITNKSSLLDVIDRANHHFSDYMRALAMRIVPGIWLKEIRINQAEQELELLGRTTSANLVPLFLSQLTKEAIFDKVEFKQLKLAKPADKTLSMGFALRTIPNEETVYIFPEDAGKQQQTGDRKAPSLADGSIISSLVNTLVGGEGGVAAVLPSLGDVLQKAKDK